MVPERSRTQSAMVKLGGKEDIWGLRKRIGCGSVMDHSLGKSQMTFFGRTQHPGLGNHLVL